MKIPGYQIFEKIRKNKGGGGLLTAVDEDLDPVLVANTKDDTEILAVEAKIGSKKIRILNGYGPQEDDDIQEILNFWQEMEVEILKAKDDECLIIIEMDANAKIGKPFIRMDPNQMSNNGRIMLDMFERQNLVIANTLEMCDGTITREIIVENKAEKSAIDYIVMCEELLEHLIEMSIDESRINVLSRYRKTKDGIKRVVLSDHNPLFSKFSITFNRRPVIIRKEYFRFKCEESKKRFHDETSTTSKLSSCFKNETNFDSSAKLFHRTLNKTVHKCFKKVRIKSGKTNS